MEKCHEVLMRAWLGVCAPRTRDERGDVPGWVLITVVTARRYTCRPAGVGAAA